MSISINKDENVRVYKTESGWTFFNLKGSERMSDGLYRDVFTKVTLKFIGDSKALGETIKNKTLLHIDNAKLSFDIGKDKEGKRVYRYNLMVFAASIVQDGEEGFYEFKKFSKENNQQTTTENNDQDTMVAADDMLPF